jgi:hypothetical protein
MRPLRIVSLTIVLLGWGLGGVAQAGDVTRTATAVTYQAVLPAAAEDVTLGLEAGLLFVSSARGAAATDCMQTDPTRADCVPAPTVFVNLLDTGDTVRADALASSIAVVAHGGGGDDVIGGAPGADRLFGDDGNDHLDGKAGDDVIDGGTGEDTITGGPGADQISGGIGDDDIDARDGQVDGIDCGPGTDTAIVDPGDTTTACESVSLPGAAAPPPPPPAPAAPGRLLASVSFAGSPKSVRVSRAGRFRYTFRATPGAAGRASLRSRHALRVGSGRRRLSVAGRSFAAPSNGIVKLTFKLSATSLRALRRASRAGFRVSVVVGGRTFGTNLLLRAPARQKR